MYNRKAPMRLVLRLIDHCDRGDWHIAAALDTFSEGAIVTLECLCNRWVFGSLTRAGLPGFIAAHPKATICPECLTEYTGQLEQDEESQGCPL